MYRIYFQRFDNHSNVIGAGVLTKWYKNAKAANKWAQKYFAGKKNYIWIVSEENPFAKKEEEEKENELLSMC